MKEYNNMLFSSLLLVLLISADQLSKYLIRAKSGFYICNPNIAFGIKLPLTLLMPFWIIIVMFLGFLIFNFKFFPPRRDPAKAVAIFCQFSICKFTNLRFFGLLFILSGAVSNMIDRVYFGCVIDFIDLKFWPVFNIADVVITTGVILILLNYFWKSKLT